MAKTSLNTNSPFCSLTLIIIATLQLSSLLGSVETMNWTTENGLKFSSESVELLIESTIHVAQKKRLSDISGSKAVNECLDLLDDSIDLLYSIGGSSGGAMCGPNTGACSSMSVILDNQEMCLEGLDNDQHHLVENKAAVENDDDAIRVTLNEMNPLLSQILSALSSQPQSMASKPHQHQPLDVVVEAIKPISAANSDVTVALDGSGDYKSIKEAINAAPSKSKKRFIIHVKRGVYHEYVEIPSKKPNLVMIGDGIDATVITGSRSSAHDHITKTFLTATFAVSGCGFMAQDITFENTAGPSGERAVALTSKANNLVFYRCAFKGYQDTLYPRAGLQFFRECKIYGTVDFICGDAAAVFQKCNIIVRKPLPNQYNTVTAQERNLACSATGFSFIGCNFIADKDLSTSATATATYLGRPWRPYSRTVVMKSYLGPLIHQAGWTPWNKTRLGLDTLYYGEYLNYGAGADVKGRVNWPGFHPHMTANEANKFTVRNFIAGDEWIPSTGVPYDPDL